MVGGASGIGRGVVERLLDQGFEVVVADINTDGLSEVAIELGDGVRTVEIDVADATSVERAIKSAAEQLGGLSVLVNAAGVIELQSFEDVSVEGWDRTIAVNLRGPFLTIKSAMPYLREHGNASIVNIASDAGKRGWPYLASYTASKFGLVGLTESLAIEFGPLGVRVNAVCPATIPTTEMGEKVLRQKVALQWGGSDREEVLRRGAESFPLQRLGTVQDVADAVLYLVSENAGWITGESMNVDGGGLSG